MPTATRTFRVFVSSTFEDLKDERDALQRDVFPRLSKLCEANNARFQAIDLRWGVRDEAALDRLPVIGPRVLASDNVAQESRFATFEAGKCVNPIVRRNGRKTWRGGEARFACRQRRAAGRITVAGRDVNESP
jgi:hypothetical protein